MNQFIIALRNILFMTVLLGIVYPLVVTALGQVAFPKNANGSLVTRNGQVIGSSLIAQKFESDRNFWSRPSATDYNPLSSGGSNLGPTSGALKEAYQSRLNKAGQAAGLDLLFASGSGLDPHISPESALSQVARVASARGVPEDQVRGLVQSRVEKRQLGLFGEERVNVFELNLALDEKR